MCDKADKTDKADNQNGKVMTVKHWKYETKAKITKHSFEKNETDKADKEDVKIMTIKQLK